MLVVDFFLHHFFRVVLFLFAFFLSSLLYLLFFGDCTRITITTVKQNTAFLDKVLILKSYINLCPEMLALSWKRGIPPYKSAKKLEVNNISRDLYFMTLGQVHPNFLSSPTWVSF